MLKELNMEHAGFMGYTHWLISIFCFFLLFLIPLDISKQFVSSISASYIFMILIFFIMGGSPLLPDLDSSPLQGGGSAAIYQLGILGNFLSLIAITISQMVYSLFHTKYDNKPESQHRMLWHAPIIPIMMFIYCMVFIPNDGNLSGVSDVKNLSSIISLEFLMHNSGIIVMVFFAGVSVYLGSNMLIYKLLKIFGKQSKTQFICLFIMAISIVYMLMMPFKQLKLIGYSMSLGYLTHVLSDVLTKGSSPLFFPIPMPNGKGKFRFWWKPYILGPQFTVTTGGALNIIINYALIATNVFLFWFIFLK